MRATEQSVTDRTFADVAREFRRWLVTLAGDIPADDKGPWERIWIAAGCLTEITYPNGLARIRRAAGEPPTAIIPVPGKRFTSKNPELARSQRDTLFEQFVLELCKYGTLDEKVPLLVAWEEQGRPRWTFDVATW